MTSLKSATKLLCWNLLTNYTPLWVIELHWDSNLWHLYPFPLSSSSVPSAVCTLSIPVPTFLSPLSPDPYTVVSILFQIILFLQSYIYCQLLVAVMNAQALIYGLFYSHIHCIVTANDCHFPSMVILSSLSPLLCSYHNYYAVHAVSIIMHLSNGWLIVLIIQVKMKSG